MDSELTMQVCDWGVDAAAAGTVARALVVLMAGERSTPAEAFIGLRWRSIQERRSLIDVASHVTDVAAHVTANSA